MAPRNPAREAARVGDYGMVIRIYRTERGLNQDELGAACGYDQSLISRLERRGPNGAYEVGMLRRVAAALDIPADMVGLADAVPISAAVGASLGGTVAQLEAAAGAARTEEQRVPVLRLLGHAYLAMGEVAFDQLKYVDAVEHFHSSHEIGTELGDADMTTAALTQLGDVARRQRRYSAALRLLISAERHAASGTVLIQVLRCQTLARAHAEIGERTEFEKAIARAETLAGTISPEHHREGDHSPRGVRLERGQGLTLLGDPNAALRIYEQNTPPVFRTDRERGSFLIILAQGLAHAGHLNEGVRRAIEGLELARRYESPRHISRVRRMYERLAAATPRPEPRLAELRDALAA